MPVASTAASKTLSFTFSSVKTAQPTGFYRSALANAQLSEVALPRRGMSPLYEISLPQDFRNIKRLAAA